MLDPYEAVHPSPPLAPSAAPALDPATDIPVPTTANSVEDAWAALQDAAAADLFAPRSAERPTLALAAGASAVPATTRGGASIARTAITPRGVAVHATTQGGASIVRTAITPRGVAVHATTQGCVPIVRAAAAPRAAAVHANTQGSAGIAGTVVPPCRAAVHAITTPESNSTAVGARAGRFFRALTCARDGRCLHVADALGAGRRADVIAGAGQAWKARSMADWRERR
ncbi:hypothetical protein GCM10022255_062570 [Dactylosporangium darangshiense]|uniref:Uncharacterized protein n=1 Tax=Dactylosporangium darangshiense TaxID=579108 RepID=A0ABP8DG39_9ACTN